MKYQLKKYSPVSYLPCFGVVIAASLLLPLPTLAASVTLATQPLATSTTSSVKPNLLFVLDNSGSMAWDHMPDDSSDGGSAVSFSFGYYGLRSSQCNQVYYDPAVTYLAPVHPDGTGYPNSSFSGAWTDGYSTGAGTTDLRTGFQASQSLAGDGSGGPAYYYSYSGAQTTALQKNYNSTTNTFYSECHSAQNASPGNNVFTKISLSATAAATTATIVASCSSCTSASVSGIMVNGTQQIMSGTAAGSTNTGTVATNIAAQINLCTGAKVGNCTTVGGHGYTASVSGSTVTLTGLAATTTSLMITQSGSMTLSPTIFPVADATKLQNFANWYSYYRTRMLMMKTATGRAFSSINQNYRVGFMTISSSSTPTVYVDTFWDNTNTTLGPLSTQRTTWYNALYNTTESGSTPLRTALSDAGMYYAGKLPGADPIQYSCQQNFTLLSTDGYWNTGNGYKLDGSTAVGNQDGLLSRPYYDGSTITTTKSTSQILMSQSQVRQSTSQILKRTQQIQSRTSSLQKGTSQLQQTTATLNGTLSKVLMRCNNTSASCGTAPATGVANANWSVVTSGSCAIAANVQCAVVSGLSGLAAVATSCDTAASITTNTSGGVTAPSNTTSAYMSDNSHYMALGLQATSPDSSRCVLLGGTGAGTAWFCRGSGTGNPASPASQSSVTDSTGKTWYLVSNVSGNTGCTTNRAAFDSGGSTNYSTSKGACPDTAGATTGYTLNNADINGKVYSACSYVSGAATGVPSCTATAQSTSSPYTVLTATSCNTVVTSAYANVTSGTCIPSGTPDGSGNTTVCRYWNTAANATWSNWANASSCTTVAQSAASPYSVLNATDCQTTDTGWAGASACTASSSGGQAVTCQTANTGATLASSCSAASPVAGNNFTTTTCATTTITAATPVASCTADAASSTNNYTTTSCNTVTTGPTAGSCTPVAASAANNYTATTCAQTVGADASSDSLADIAAYYYQTDLRTPALLNCGTAVAPATVGPLCDNNVFMSGNDRNIQQHMTTFTLGLGASGWMNYSSSYLNDTTGDYVAVKNGSVAHPAATPPACSWQADGTTCNWPIPGITSGNGWIANIDDLWHAAVNGHGVYFSATNPTSLSDGLSNALAGINARKGSAAAAATSTLNPVAGNNAAFVASYTTVTWKGNLEARGINTNTGQVNENADWCVENVPAGNCPAPGSVVGVTSGSTTTYSCVTPNAVTCTGGTMNGSDCYVPVATSCTGTMNTKVSTSSDTRTIKTANSTGTALINFDAAYAAANPAYFNAAHISTLSQWSLLTSAQQAAAQGASLVNYLRGQYMYEDRTTNLVTDRLYRYREALLGDALESQPAFIGSPVFGYPYTGYSDYKIAKAGRAGTVYMGANDGMMHAFAADTGIERWAYVPSMVIPNMWILADKNYSTLHRNFVNGSPITSDVYCPGNCGGVTDAIYGDSASWRTILVAGLNGGGRGYFALDITDPVTPILLWEFTTTAGIGKVKDDDVGYSFGQPIITRKADGTWVVLVTSGYNNTSPGSGRGYLYVLNANTGAIISKISSGGVGSITTPSGLAKIAGWNDEPAGNQVGYVYGGDLLGNVWRFDINSPTPPAVADGEIGNGDAFKFAVLYSEAAATNRQPITSTPTLGLINGKRIVFIGTGKYLEIGDLTTTQIQTIYAIKDDNATATLINPRTILIQQTLTNAGASRTVSSNAVNFFTDRGWYVDLPDTGERINIDSKLVQGTLLVPSIVPSSTACTPGGYGWLNFFNYQTGASVAPTADPASLVVSLKYDATIVGINVLYVKGKPLVGVVTSNNPTPELNTDIGFSGSAAGFSGKRVIWRELLK